MRMVVWIQERGWKNGGIWVVTILLKMSVPTRAASGANRRRPAANWHGRRRILSVSPAAPTEHRGPPRSQRASESFMFSLQLANACMTRFLRCTVRRFRGVKTNISAERKCCSSALFAAVMNCSFVIVKPGSLPLSPSLPSSLSD